MAYSMVVYVLSYIGRNFIFCQRRYHFGASDFVVGKIYSNALLQQFKSCKHEQRLRYAAFIRELVSSRDLTSAVCASYFVALT